MNHPLIGNIDHLTLEELQTKVSELTKKLSMAHRMGNAQLVDQIRLALNTYQSKYQEKQAEFWKSQTKPGNDYSDRIDIS